MNNDDCALRPLSNVIPLPQDQKSTGGSNSDAEQEKLQKTLDKLKQGYTRIPNTILVAIIAGNLSKAEIKILLLVARFTISYKERETAPLSKSSIQRLTGVQGKGVLQAIQSLIEKTFLKKLTGNYYTKNQLGLIYDRNLFKTQGSSEDAELEAIKTESPDENSENTPAQDQKITQGQKVTQWQGLLGTYPQGVKSTHFKPYSVNHNSKNTLSLNPSVISKNIEGQGSDLIQSYFQNLKPERKRETEWKNFLSLRGDYSTEQISNALKQVINHGLLKSGVHCHSPMAYLAVTIREVLLETNKVQQTRNNIAEQAKQKDLQAIRAEEQAGQEERRFEEKTSAFQREFPNTERREEYFSQFAKRYPVLNANGPILKNLAISAWAAESQFSNENKTPSQRGNS